ncbi:F0F1 ATP synthase subunit delta [Candidatus Saccharibacteria bacterium]|nr:F0F1 ATP synthase subunit delta [Candidatus Saccharibacteria bacterium]
MNELRHDVARIIAEKTMHVMDKQKLVREVAEFLVEENLTNDLDAIIREIMGYRAEHGHIEAVAISAHELSNVDLKDIQDILKQEYPDAKSFVIDTRIDPTVVGGVKIEMPGELLDLTLSNRLNVFKHLAAAGKE